MVEVLILGAVVAAFDVAAWDALWLAWAEAGLVVPRAVGLLGVLVLAVAVLRVRVVEAAVDGAEVRGPPVHTHTLV